MPTFSLNLICLIALAPIRIAKSLFLSKMPAKREPPLILFGFSPWKIFIRDWFPHHRVIFTPKKMSAVEFHLHWRWVISQDARTNVLAWQYNALPQVKQFCGTKGIGFAYVEDGFIRSVKLGALHVPPISLAFDRQDVYFNANAKTDLENILSDYDFDNDTILVHRARLAIEQLVATGLSKYNSGTRVEAKTLYGPKTAKRILVIGQVERDASIAYGCSRNFSNNDLVRLAREENPDAEIIYKPHPEVLQGTAPRGSDPFEVQSLATILEVDVSLADCLQTVDHVYTITSLAGFEALLRGITVTTIGCPFYSGWGLTDDRQANSRRCRKLSVEQLFAGAYILYPRYLDPDTKAEIDIERALDVLSKMRAQEPDLKMPPATQAHGPSGTAK
ncbi:capsular polysaccharide export protein [Rhizobium sp. NFR07]|uniref:capsular polysaccharide export protein, LipB/KpsS family n=1 Tax=Rhizobium sp. NFR07 TaxID=1566262 RepID=UPI0008E50B24|nr:capsular polysaccharide biosynthesis protein [Rhizobium sp. NFR07]SFB59610.1 capsular polysaccharide export protein [Rhizobium sp. NFR07]